MVRLTPTAYLLEHAVQRRVRTCRHPAGCPRLHGFLVIAFMLLLLHDLEAHCSRRKPPSDLDGLATAHMLLPVEGPEIRGVLSVLNDMRAKDAQQFPPVAQRKQRERTML